MKTIFISYRRNDASGQAGRICDRFVQHFGREKVFFDVDSLSPGNWKEQLNKALENCSVMVVIIGDEWLKNEKGMIRLQNPEDPVRLEIEAGLKRKVIVIPTLVDKAQLGTEQKDLLPETLRPLLDQQMFEVRHEHFDDDINRLLKKVEVILGGKIWRWMRRYGTWAMIVAIAWLLGKYFINGNQGTHLSGIVQTVSGKNVEGAQIRLAELGDTMVTTTADGRFYFAHVPRKTGDTVGLTISKQGFLDKRLRVVLGRDAQVVLEEKPQYTKTIRIIPLVLQNSHLVSGTISMTDKNGKKVMELANWNQKDFEVTLTEGEYSLKVNLSYRTPAGQPRRCEGTRSINFSNTQLEPITLGCQ